MTRRLHSSCTLGKKRPILSKKLAMVSTTEKYAFEIEILTLIRGFRGQIACSGAQKNVFSDQYAGSLEEPNFSTETARSSPLEIRPSDWTYH
jgi:hypothetical protein